MDEWMNGFVCLFIHVVCLFGTKKTIHCDLGVVNRDGMKRVRTH